MSGDSACEWWQPEKLHGYLRSVETYENFAEVWKKYLVGAKDEVKKKIIHKFVRRIEIGKNEVTIEWLDKNGFKYHGLVTDKPRCLNPDDEYVWVDNRKVRGITYNSVWGDLKEVNKKILTFGD